MRALLAVLLLAIPGCVGDAAVLPGSASQAGAPAEGERVLEVRDATFSWRGTTPGVRFVGGVPPTVTARAGDTVDIVLTWTADNPTVERLRAEIGIGDEIHDATGTSPITFALGAPLDRPAIIEINPECSIPCATTGIEVAIKVLLARGG